MDAGCKQQRNGLFQSHDACLRAKWLDGSICNLLPKPDQCTGGTIATTTGAIEPGQMAPAGIPAKSVGKPVDIPQTLAEGNCLKNHVSFGLCLHREHD